MNLVRCFCSGLFITAFLFGCIGKSSAQESSGQSHQIQPMSGDTRIWTGSANLRWYNFYRLTSGGLEEQSNTELDLEFRHLWLTSSNFGWGLQGMTQIYMVDLFGNVGLGNVGLGPLLRVYPWQNKHWQLYLEGNSMVGYDLALSDGLGANQEGMRYRLGLRSGFSYRVSDKFGVYLELGPDWEASNRFEFDSRAFQLDVGIQLFRF